MDKTSNQKNLPAKNPKSAMLACIVISVLVIALYFVPYGWYVLYPFMLIYTFIHESGHGIAGEMVGGDFKQFEMWSDGSGMATTMIPSDIGHFAKAFIAFGGLIAPAIMAAIFLLLGRSGRASRVGMLLFTLMCAAAIIFLVPFTNPFGIAFIGGCGLVSGVIALGPKSNKVPQYSMLVLAITLLTAVFSRGDYLFTDTAQTAQGLAPSDVGQIADNLILPYWFWGGLIAALSVLILILGIKGFFYSRSMTNEAPKKQISEE